MDNSIILIAATLLFSTTIRTAFGFGDALVAMPLLSMIIGAKTAAPIIAFISVIVTLYIIITHREKVQLVYFKKLLISSIIGVPIGALYLKYVNETIIQIVLALIAFSFASYKLFKPDLLELKNERYSYLFGFIAGALGGAYNTNGPPIIIYGTLRRWPASIFRELLQGIFLPINVMIVVSHGLTGLWNKNVFIYFTYSLPAVIAAIALGSFIHKKVQGEIFYKILYIMLIIISISLFIKASA